MKKIFILIAFTFAVPAFCQINAEDSSVQIITYWDKNEAHTYSFIAETAEVKGTDTIVTESIKYMVDITVLDSTASSYTVQWKYRDYVIESKNPVTAKLAKLNEGLTLKFKTNEMGSFMELLNWTDVKQFNQNALKVLEKEKDATQLQNFMAMFRDKYSSKEAIERHSMKDVQQFHDFYGIAVKLNEPINETVTEQNPITNQDLVSTITVSLAEIDAENSSYLVGSTQQFDETSAGQIIRSMLAGMFTSEQLSKLQKVDIFDSNAVEMHNSGWPLSMYFERQLNIEGRARIESKEIIFEN